MVLTTHQNRWRSRNQPSSDPESINQAAAVVARERERARKRGKWMLSEKWNRGERERKLQSWQWKAGEDNERESSEELELRSG